MKLRQRLFGISVLLLLVVLSSALFIWVSPGFSGLRAEYSEEAADIGIPGTTKMYDARLVNTSLRPVRVEVCKFVDDGGGRGEAVAFSVQKYDAKISGWKTIVDASDAKTCQPYALGWVTAELIQKWLLPGQWVTMGEEATAARGFRKGESARFVLFTSFKRAGEASPRSVPTPAFVIDEEAGEGVQGLRVRH